MAHNVAASVRLMLVTDDALLGGRDLVEVCRAAEAGGVTSVQLRRKTGGARRLAEAVRALVEALRIPVLVNDRPDVALAAGAAGVHLGADDVPVALVKPWVPSGFMVGASVGDPAEAAAHAAADYWGIGPWRVTRTKADAGAALGAEGFAELVRLAGGRPCIAIGGVLAGDVPAVLDAGGSGVAAVSGLLRGSDPRAAARAYLAAFERAGGRGAAAD